MDLKELWRSMTRSFCVIVTATLLVSALFNTFITPLEYISADQLWQILYLGTATTLPHIIFYSKKELGKKQWLIRQLIHGGVLSTILLSLAICWQWINPHDLKQLILFLLSGIVIYYLVWLSSFHKDCRTAKELNTNLERFKRKNQDKNGE